MNRKRARIVKLKSMAEDIDYATPQKTLTSTAYLSQNNTEKDFSCLYVHSCTLQNCLSCKRLK